MLKAVTGHATIASFSDYEVGAWTPAIAGTSTPGAQTYSLQVGQYIRIGRLVYATGVLVMTAKDVATSGQLRITGLPFATANDGNYYAAQISGVGNFGLSAGKSWITAHAPPNMSHITLQEAGDNVGSAVLTQAALNDTTAIIVSVTYLKAP